MAAAALKRGLLGSSQPKSRAGEFEAALVGADAESHRVLGHHIDLADGLIAFATHFVLALDGTLALVDALLSVVRAVEPQWLSPGEHTTAKAQVWAVAMGVKATAPRVAKELRAHLTSLEEVKKATLEARVTLEKKGHAQQERNHYLLKVQGMRMELEERQAAGKTPSSEQLERLVRNQEKLAKAELDLDDAAVRAKNALEQQRLRNRTSLMGSLRDLAQTVSCGWFISTGAVVCRALQEASATEHTEQSPPEQKPAKPQRPHPRGVLELPSNLDGDLLEPPSRFNPLDPFGEEASMPGPVGLELCLLPVSPEEEAVPSNSTQQPSIAEVSSLSVRELRERLRRLGVPHQHCVEKGELVALLEAHADPEPVSQPEPVSPQVEPASSGPWGAQPSWPPGSEAKGQVASWPDSSQFTWPAHWPQEVNERVLWPGHS